MTQGPIDTVLRRIRDLSGSTADVTDGQLLECFARHRDPAAFELLLRRHGPMVHAVCRRILRDAGEAEDAFQATFLVLVRRAADLNRMGSLAGWLHGVAYRVAVRARARALRRPGCDTEATEMAPARPAPESPEHDLRPVIDEELARLPDKYRLPLVLCYLEGRTHEEAAHALGWPKGTVSGRLARAREQLRGRLARRGLTVSAGIMLALLAEESASAVPPALTAATTRLVLDAGAGAAAASPSLATALADEIVASAAGSKLRLLVAGVVAAAAVAVGAGVVVSTRVPAPVVVRPGVPVGLDGKPLAGPEAHVREPSQPDAHGDPMPMNALRRLGTVRLRKGRLHDRITFEPAGRILATAAPEGGYTFWDPDSGMGFHMRSAGEERLAALLWLPDGNTLATAGVAGTIRLLDPRTGKEIATLKGPPRAVLASSPDGKLLAAAGPARRDGEGPAETVCIYDLEARQLRFELKGHRGNVWDVAFSGDGRSVVTGGEDGTVRVWDAGTGRQRFERNAGGAVRAVVAGPADAGLFATGEVGGTIRIWDLSNGKELHEKKEAHEGCVASLAWSPDGKTLASHGVEGGDVELWNVASGERIGSMPSRESAGASVVFAPNGRSVALGGATVHLWDTPTRKPLHSPIGHEGEVTSLAFAPGGKLLASGGDDRTVILWDLQTGKELARMGGHSRAVTALAFAADGKTLASGEKGSFVRLWDPGKGQQQRRLDLKEIPLAMAFSPDGSGLRWRNVGGAAGLWKLPDGKEPTHFRGCAEPAKPGEQPRRDADPLHNRGALSADGRLMASPCPDRKVRVWDLETGKELTAVEVGEGSLGTAALSPDGKRLATSSDKRVTLWDVATGKKMGSPGESGSVTALTFSSDGKWLVLGTREGLLSWCDGTDGRDVAWYQAHRAAILALAFSPDSAMLASGSFDTTVMLWRRP